MSLTFNRFKDVVECDYIVVKAFLTGHEVSSYRSAKLSDDFYLIKSDMEKKRTLLLNKEEASRQATQDALKGNVFALLVKFVINPIIILQ